MWLFVLAFEFVACFGFDPARAEFYCGASDSLLPPVPGLLQKQVPVQQLHFKFIYLGFADTPSQDLSLSNDMLVTMPSGFEQVIERQSRGQVDAIVEVLTRSDFPDRVWEASLGASEYYSDPAVCNPPQPDLCVDCNREYQSEVVEQVYQDYTTSGRGNPFDSGDYFVLIPRDYPHPQFGGTSALGVKVSGLCHPYVGAQAVEDGWLRGFWGVWGPNMTKETAGMVLFHELGHQFGLRDYITGLNGSGAIEDAYSWGNYNGMRGYYVQDEGFVPFLTSDLVEIGWYQDSVLVNDSMRSVRLDDLRDANVGGVTYRVELESFSWTDNSIPFFGQVPVNSTQYFLIGFHGRQAGSEDAELNTVGDPIYRSRGLAIWHVVESTVGAGHPFLIEGNPYTPGDSELIEIASGRWQDPATRSVADPKNGVTLLNGYSGRTIAQLKDYHGDADDLFTTIPGRSEFSFRSNPNTFGVLTGAESASAETPNSIFIEVLEDNGDHAIVDILLAPLEDIIFPTTSEDLLVVGQPAIITWTQDRTLGWDGQLPYDAASAQVIDTVDIYLSLDGGETFQSQAVIEGAPNTGAFAWTPDETQVSSAAILKLVFHNTLSTQTGESTSNEPFTITRYTFENLSFDSTASPGDEEVASRLLWKMKLA